MIALTQCNSTLHSSDCGRTSALFNRLMGAGHAGGCEPAQRIQIVENHLFGATSGTITISSSVLPSVAVKSWPRA